MTAFKLPSDVLKKEPVTGTRYYCFHAILYPLTRGIELEFKPAVRSTYRCKNLRYECSKHKNLVWQFLEKVGY